ncbi:hypothetical protein PG994_008364 [Apiospora phragmitis]|uniref:Uncharacterized protein n=1 Tax=Apiospora phragmitis TaxID=2905665 RepID=A0ABR1UVY6_9PEZI
MAGPSRWRWFEATGCLAAPGAERELPSGGGSGTTTSNSSHAETAYSVYTNMMNTIEISQPEVFDPERSLWTRDGMPYAISDQFVVASSWTKIFLGAQNDLGHDEEYKRTGGAHPHGGHGTSCMGRGKEGHDKEGRQRQYAEGLIRYGARVH